MLFTPKEIEFVKDAHEKILSYMREMRKGNVVDREIPTFKTISKLRDLHSKGRSIQGDVDKEQNEIKKFIVEALESFQIIKIEKMNLKSGSAKPQTMLFHSATEPDNEQIIKIRNKKNLLSLTKRQCDNLVEGLGSVKNSVKVKGEDILVDGVNATSSGARAAAKAVKKGAIFAKEGIVKGVKKTGEGALFVGRGVVAGAGLVGGGVALGANAVWEQVIEPAGTAIANAVERAITAMQDAVRRENIKDAHEAIEKVLEQALLVLENSLEAELNVLRILKPSLSPNELINLAKENINYDGIQQSLITVIDNVIDLQDGTLSLEDPKEYISNFKGALENIQTEINTIVDKVGEDVDVARATLQNRYAKKQHDTWLLEDLKEYRSLKDLKAFINKLHSSKGYSDDKYNQEYFDDIVSILEQVELLCRQKNRPDYSEQFVQIIDDLNSITNSSDDEQIILADLSEEDTIKLTKKLNEAIDKIAEFDSVQYALEVDDKFAPSLKNAEYFLDKANESQTEMEKYVKKAKHALKAADSFAVGVLRLGAKGLNYVLSGLKDTINSIWNSMTEIITTKLPELASSAISAVGGAAKDVGGAAKEAAENLLEFTSEITGKISDLGESFLGAMHKIIGIRKSKENEHAIYQHQAFQPGKIREVIQDRIKKFDDYARDSNDYVIIAHKPNEEKPYPYRVTTKLKFKDHKHNMILVKEVDLMVVYKDSIHFTPALDLDEFTKKGLVLPMQEEDKFNDAQLELIKILGNDERGLLSTPRAESIKIKHFNTQGMEVFLDTRVMREHPDKVHVKDASQATLEELKKRRNLPKKSASQKLAEHINTTKTSEVETRFRHMFGRPPVNLEDVKMVVTSSPLPKRGGRT